MIIHAVKTASSSLTNQGKSIFLVNVEKFNQILATRIAGNSSSLADQRLLGWIGKRHSAKGLFGGAQ